MTEVSNSYGPTAARSHGRPGRDVRPKSLTLDIHSHIAIPQAAAFAKPHVDLTKVPLFHFSTPETKALNLKQDADRSPLMTQYDQRLRDMDSAGIDMQLVMPPPPQCYFQLPIDIAEPATRMVNDGMAEWVAGKPDRFVGLGTVPLQDGAAATKELERVMGQLKLKGVQILTNVDGRELSDPAFAPFWAKAEALGAVVLLHPNGFTEGQRLSRHYFNNVVGNPFETTLALHYLIFDGVLERHPGLKIIAVHGGGYLSAYSGRIDHAWGARSDTQGHNLKKKPTEYLKQVWVDTVVFTNHQLRTLIEVFGADKVVMGTDYPYDMAESDPVGHVANAGLDADVVAKLCGGNAKVLLGL